jgi:glycosyltransferase involved in cell wall biosynthesis
MGSGAVAGMLAAHRALGTWRRAVDLFVTPSEYARRKLANAMPSERIVVKPHFIADVGAGSGEGGYALIAGRLSPEKGIATLLRAWASGDERLPELRIVGDGPLTQLVTRAAAENPKVRYLGRKSLAEVVGLMGRASLVLYPSEWAETFGRSVIEAMSVGTPVVCSQGGAHSELVEDGVTGLSFPAGEARALAAAVVRLVTNRDRYAAMRRNARLAYLARYTPEKVLNTLLEAYDRARERRDHRMSRH